MAAALFDTKRRWDGHLEGDAILLDALTQVEAARLPASEIEHRTDSIEKTNSPTRYGASSHGAVAPVDRPQDPRDHVKPDAISPKAPGGSHPPDERGSPILAQTEQPLDDAISVVVESLLEGRMANVAEKTKRQVRSAGKFFSKYLCEVHGIKGLRALRQPHLKGFVTLLQNEAYIHHGKSERDESRTLAELREVWKTKPKNQIGIDKPTQQRWTQQLSQILKEAKSIGLTLDRDLTFDNLVASQPLTIRARYARPTLKVAQSEELFHQPPFTGCAAWDAICEVGPMVFHGAIYFATMLIHYGGERREEICGALADDVITDNGPIPYLYIINNKFRRIKNLQSTRVIAIHPELVRLGFLDYVAAIKALGYELLFPDLYSPTTSSPLGDRYHDNLRPVLDMAGITEKGTGSHSARRGFGNNLKQKNVHAEKRAELLGHRGDTETTERYCNAYEVELLFEAINELPIVTAHLEPRQTMLLPWVQAKQVAPFSQPGRTKEAKKLRREAKSSGK